jgi:hypothetical protein
MRNKLVLGGIIGALVILVLTFGILMIISTLLGGLGMNQTTLVISVITIFLAPLAGGFTAGSIGRSNPKRAGLIAGISASLVVFVSWIIISGLVISNILSGLLLVFVWIVLTIIASGFIKPE